MSREQLEEVSRMLRSVINRCELPASSSNSNGPDTLYKAAHHLDRLVEGGGWNPSSLYSLRRRREKVFGVDGLFADPAWDVLLDLYDAHLADKRVQVTSACIASAVPATTALRWINVLEKHGLVERKRDLDDGRRSWLRLTSKAEKTMAELLVGCRL